MTKQSISAKTMFTYVFSALIVFTMFFPESAWAAVTLPWDKPLTTLSNSLRGPVAKGVCLIVVVATGLMISFGEVGGAGKKMLQIVFGIAIGLGATSIIGAMFAEETVGILF